MNEASYHSISTISIFENWNLLKLPNYRDTLFILNHLGHRVVYVSHNGGHKNCGNYATGWGYSRAGLEVSLSSAKTSLFVSLDFYFPLTAVFKSLFASFVPQSAVY